LLGENGAGKSTVIKVISGTTRLASGRIFIDGVATPISSRKDSEAIGIETIYQEPALVDQISTTRDLFLSREPTNFVGLMRMTEVRKVAMGILTNAVSISGIDDPDKEAGLLSGGQKQAVALAK
jgi:simple sugar transport system ATP-binding protein